jgi:ATP-dependent Clp protease adaptor protein ClpS
MGRADFLRAGAFTRARRPDIIAVRINYRTGGCPQTMSHASRTGKTPPSTDVIIKTRTKPKTPSLYKVLMLNDDYTPMEFVVHVLEKFFGKNRSEATRIMLHVHQRGVGICGVFTYEVAESKVSVVIDYARKHQHPLQCTLEKE